MLWMVVNGQLAIHGRQYRQSVVRIMAPSSIDLYRHYRWYWCWCCCACSCLYTVANGGCPLGELSRCDKVRLIKAAMAFEMQCSHAQAITRHPMGTCAEHQKKKEKVQMREMHAILYHSQLQ